MASYLKLQCLLLSYFGGRILRPLKVGIHRVHSQQMSFTQSPSLSNSPGCYQLYDLHSTVEGDISLWSFFLLVNVDIGQVFKIHPGKQFFRALLKISTFVYELEVG